MPIDPFVGAVFFLVYAGMVLGDIPGLALDRTGIALLGAIAIIASDRIPLEAALGAVDFPTIALLLGLMVVSAQLRLGVFTALTRRLGSGDHSPHALLALVVVAAGVLSAVLANDIVCLAMAPVLVEICARKGLAPVPYLLALACASNVGSAATLIGNPQMASREMLGLVDWHLVVLFISLFVVNAAVAHAGLLDAMLVRTTAAGLSMADPATLFGVTALLSNLVSNVPEVMLLLLPAARHDLAGPILALSSTLAGNLLVVGSIANIIVIDQAARLGVTIDWRTHARVGIPVTLLTLAIAAGWLVLMAPAA